MDKREIEREKIRNAKMLDAFREIVKIMRTVSPKKRERVLRAIAILLGYTSPT